MDAVSFCEAIRRHPKLHPAQGPDDDKVYVIYTPGDGVQIGWELDPTSILEQPWEILEQVLTGARRAEIMYKVTRIVGYYSEVKNWNASKLAELRDRHHGHYILEEAPG